MSRAASSLTSQPSSPPADAPAGTPPAVVARLSEELRRILAMPDIQQKIAEQGGDVVAETPEQFAAFIKAETAKWGKVVKDSGATVD